MKQSIVLCAIFFCALLSPAIGATSSEAYMVFTTPGENVSQEIHITWHSSVSGTWLEYTRAGDLTYSEATQVRGEAVSELFDSTTFQGEGFYRCHVSLESLQAGTDYIFRVGKTGFSGDHRFRTATHGGEFSFILMSDVHAYPSIQSRVNTADSLVDRARQLHQDLDFILFAGDLTAHGANYTHWENLADASFVSDFLMATSPGNHDYYDSSATTIDDSFYNSIFKNPDNGPIGAQNSSYWFKYGNALFFALNSEARSSSQLDAKRAWLGEVIEDNPSQYVIVIAHRAFFLGSTNTAGGGVVRKSSDTYPSYGHLLEELDVDLVLAGHNHVYVRTKPIRGGEVADNGDGTVYITTNQIGDRGRMAAADLGEYAEVIYGGSTTSNNISAVSIITVSERDITGRMFDASGTVHDTYSIPARRNPPADDFDHDAYAGTFSVEIHPPDLGQGVLRFGAEGFDRVSNISVIDLDAEDLVHASFQPASDMTEAYFGPLEAGKTYRLAVVISFMDTSFRERHFTFVNKRPPGSYQNLRIEKREEAVLLKWDNNLVVSEVDRLDISLNDEWRINVAPNNSSVDIDAGLRHGPNSLEFAVIDIYEDLIFLETLDYVHHTEAEEEEELNEEEGGAEDPTESPQGERWEVVGTGCGSSSALGLLLFFVVGLMAVRAGRPFARS